MICVKITKNNVSKVVPLVDQQVKVNGAAHVFTEPCKMLIGNTLYPLERPIDKHVFGLYYAYQNKLYYYRDTVYDVACQKMELIATGASGTWSGSSAGNGHLLCGSDWYYVSGATATLISGLPSGARRVVNNYFGVGGNYYHVSGATATLISGLPSSTNWETDGYVQDAFTHKYYHIVGATATLISGLPSGAIRMYGDYFFSESDENFYYVSGATATLISGLPSGAGRVVNNYFGVGGNLYYATGASATMIATDTSGSWYNVGIYTGNYFGCGLNLYKVSGGSTVTLLGSGNSGTWSEVRQFLLACGPDLYYTGYGAAANSLVPIENLPSGWEYLGDYFFAVGTSVYRVGLSSNGTGYAWSVSGLPSGWMYLKDNYFYKGSDLYYVTSTGTSYKAYKVTGLSSGWKYIMEIRFHCGTSLYGIKGDTSSGFRADLLAVTKGNAWRHCYGNIYGCGTELYDLNASQYGTSDADIARLPFYFYNS